MNSIYICLVAITVVKAGWRPGCNKNGCVILEEGNAAASVAEKPVMSNDNDVTAITYLHGFLSAISENENGEENCETDIDNLMDLFDDSLSFCTEGDDGNNNCMNKEQYKQQVLIPGCGQYKETHSSFVILETKTDYSDSYQPYTSSIYLNVTWILIAADHCKTTRTKDEIISYNAQGLITKVEIFGVKESTICPFKEIEYESQAKSRYATSTNPNIDEALMRITDLYDLHDEIVEGQGGEENCRANINNYMALFDDGLTYCEHDRNDDSNCMNYDQFKGEMICGVYKEADAYFDINEIKTNKSKSYQSYISSISISGTYIVILTNDCIWTRSYNNRFSYNEQGSITHADITMTIDNMKCSKPETTSDSSEVDDYAEELMVHLHGLLAASAETKNREENCQTNIDNLMDLYDDSLSYCIEGDYETMDCMNKEQLKEQILIPECGRYKEADSSFEIHETRKHNSDSYQSYTSIHLTAKWTLLATDYCKTTRTQNEIISYNTQGLITKMTFSEVKEFKICPSKAGEYESELEQEPTEYQQDDDDAGRLLQNLVVDAPVGDDPLYGGYTKVTNTEQLEYIESNIVKLEAEIRKYKDVESMSLIEAYYKYISADRIRHRCSLEYVGPLPPAVTHEDGSITRFGPPLSIGWIEYDVVADKEDPEDGTYNYDKYDSPKLVKMEQEKEKGYDN